MCGGVGDADAAVLHFMLFIERYCVKFYVELYGE